MHGHGTAKTGIAGRSVLLVEDEWLVSMLVQDVLDDLGCELAGVAAEFEEAMKLASSLVFDVAILDVNLRGRESYPIAEVLRRKGAPFIFSTGYGAASLPEMFGGVPVIAKPFDERDLQRALKAALASGGGE